MLRKSPGLRRYLFKLLLMLIWPSCLLCQTVVISQTAPDCIISMNAITATGQSPAATGFDNRSQGCSYWILQLASSGFSVISINVQSAPDSAGAAGTWATWAGTIAGTLPVTGLTQTTLQLGGYFPWVRINRATLTGTGQVTGTLQGWRNPPSPCLTGTTTSAAFNVNGSGDNQIIAAVAGQTIRICHWDAVPASPIAIGLDSGTGSNCATNNATLTAAQAAVTAVVFDYQPGIQAPVGAAVCINLGSGVATKGTVIYAQQP